MIEDFLLPTLRQNIVLGFVHTSIGLVVLELIFRKEYGLIKLHGRRMSGANHITAETLPTL